MTHNRDHIVIHQLTQPVVFGEGGKPAWPRVWHLLAVPAVAGFVLGLLF
jgi:hypothetical protein